MPFNYITPPLTLRGFFRRFALREIPGEKRQGMFATEKARIPEIAARVRARASVGLDVTIDPITRMVDRLHLKETLGKKVWLKIAGIDEPTRLSFLESRQLMDHGFHADENCIECGICVQVCPVSNIEMVDGRPAWHHRCEQCFACLQWCPQEALQFREGTVGKWRYHHPEVALRDMVQSAPSR
jgi:ferredoxin